MIVNLFILFLYLLAFAFILYGLWVIVPFFYGLPWVPTEMGRARRALEMTHLQPGELLYDLGAGDGRILFLAAEEFGARAVGIEASFLQAKFIAARIRRKGTQAEVQVRRENFYQADISDADVVFAYLTSDQAIRLQDKLEEQLKPGARVVAVAFDFADWKPNAFDDENLLFMYKMPVEKGGLTAYLVNQDDEAYDAELV